MNYWLNYLILLVLTDYFNTYMYSPQKQQQQQGLKALQICRVGSV